jgi:succinyl-CoA synthetase alpha subunit/GNAT superfamily N-acetyltransferase
VVRVRSLVPSDRSRLVELVGRASDRSLYQRFLSASPTAAHQYLDVLDDRARTLDAAVVEVHGEVVAVGSTHQTALPTVAEVALLIDDRHQGLGLGTLLLEELADRAHRRGLRALTALLLTENVQIKRVLRDLGRDVDYEVDGDTTTAVIDVCGRQPSATARRRRVAAAHSLEPFLHPGSVIVVASATRPAHAYREILARLHESDREHRELRVTAARLHRSARRPAWLSPQHATRGADLAVLVVRPNELSDAVQACLRAGVRAVAALGPSLDPDAAPPAQGIAAACAEAGTRLLGPDSFGLLNTDAAQAFDATTLPFRARSGEVCLVAASRRHAAAVAGLLDVVGVGLSIVVGVGQGADLTAADVVAFADEDPRSRVTVVCLDGPAAEDAIALDGNGGTTVVLCVPPGASLPSLPGPPLGAIVTRSWIELADTVVLVLCQPRPQGRRVGMVTTSALVASATDDALESAGLFTADVTQHTEMRTRLIVPDATHTGGVVVVPPDTDPRDVGVVLRTLADDPGVDALIVAVELGAAREQAPEEAREEARGDTREELATVLDQVARDCPRVTIVAMGPQDGAPATPRAGTVPTLPDLQRVVGALANVRRD